MEPLATTVSDAVLPAPIVDKLCCSVIPGADSTVKTKVSLLLSEPSLTVTVMVTVPVWPLTGVTRTVRFAPLPPKTILALGTKLMLLLLPLSVSEDANDCAPPTVKAIAPVLLPAAIVWSAMSEIVGAPSSAITLKRIWVEYWPLQSLPASHVIFFALPIVTPAPIAPLSVVAGMV